LNTWIGRARDKYRQAIDESSMANSIAPLRLAILGICSKIANNDNLNMMWDKRRNIRK